MRYTFPVMKGFPKAAAAAAFFLAPLLLSCGAEKAARSGQGRADSARCLGLPPQADGGAFLRAVTEFDAAESAALDLFVGGLSAEEKVCQLFIENLEGSADFVPAERTGALSGAPKSGGPLIPGGYLFFAYNIADDPQTVIGFTDSIRAFCGARNLIPPFLAVDQEGGTVSRLRRIAGPLPSEEAVARRLDIASARELYALQAVQMRALGFHMNLAPVAEIRTPENEKFLSSRSFGGARNVAAYGAAAVSAFQDNGIGAVLKHFPGNANTDPHTGLPEIALPPEALAASLSPFRRLIDLAPAGVVMSHARTSAVDPGMPACLSAAWTTETLREKLGFRGIIFSDDIFMAALSENGWPPEKAAVMAIEAGADCIMISEKRFAAPASVLIRRAEEDGEFARKIDAAVRRVLLYKMRRGIFSLAPDENGRPHLTQDARPSVRPPQGGGVRRFSRDGPARRLSSEQRLCEFEDARRRNVGLYRQYFSASPQGAEARHEEK